MIEVIVMRLRKKKRMAKTRMDPKTKPRTLKKGYNLWNKKILKIDKESLMRKIRKKMKMKMALKMTKMVFSISK